MLINPQELLLARVC